MSRTLALVRFGLLALATATAGGCTWSTVQAPPLAPSPGAVQLYAVGDIADCRRSPPHEAAAHRTAALVPPGALVLGLGDMTYPFADATTLANCYQPVWGVHRSTTLAVAGNHDYVDGDAREFRDYFALDGVAVSDRFVAYARALGPDWLLVVLDSNVAGAAMAEQRAWLERTLERVRPKAEAPAVA
ncbi:MAG TPA: hypothetical protein VFP48_06425, partial [Steroidobacteraceae bacterium]|nr:hypothetical protein [Steroidobacteraceae bacterium]